MLTKTHSSNHFTYKGAVSHFLAGTLALSLMCLLAFLLGSCSNDQQEQDYLDGTRIIQPLNTGWTFRLQTHEQAKPVSLPHTWNAKDGQDGGDDYHRGTGIYSRELTLDDRYRDKRILLHFDGAAIVTEVLVNRVSAGTHEGSYGAFRFDITDLVQIKETNQIEVRVNNEEHSHIAPLSAEFTFFGGLYRQVRLIATNPTHFDTLDHASSGVFWTQKDVSKERALLNVRSTLVNNSNQPQSITIDARLAKHTGELVASATQELQLAAEQTAPLSMSLALDNPRLWHGRRDPYLYQTSISLSRNGELLDSITEPIGLRSFHVDQDKGFFLNSEPYPLYGINRMPDFKGKGTAISTEEHEQDLALIMELGATSIRLGHQQRDKYVYRRADELGLLVWAEIPLINRIEDGPQFRENLTTQALELVRQNYNRTSIVFWGLYNEITLKPGPDPRPLVKELDALVRAEDPQRLTTAAVAAEGGIEDSLVTTPDLISFNRYDGWYYGNLGSFAEFLDHMHSAAPKLRFGISEFGAGASVATEFQTNEPVAQDHSEQYQALYHEAYWEAMRQRPWVWGAYIWVLADFAVDDRNEGDTPGRNDKGLVTFDRKIKKDAFYWYKANWSDEPVLHIAGRRHTPRTRGAIDLKLYSNLDSVELTVNGKSLGSKHPPRDSHQLLWQSVPLQMGDNRIEAKARVNGKTISDSITLQRITSSDTRLGSTVLGIDNETAKIYNAPHGATLAELQSLLQLPESGRLEILEPSATGKMSAGDTLRVTAQDGVSTRDFILKQAPLSVARPVSASSEIAGDMSIGPIDIPEMSAANANDGIVTEGDNGLTEINIWNTMGGKSHWWKVDLGAEYYLDRIEIVWPQHASMIEPGPMAYAVEVAPDFKQTFDNFAETFEEVVDQRSNERVGTTVDRLNASGRFVRLRLIESNTFADTPLMGKYPIFGAEEITVTGGLIYSTALDINYIDRTIPLPSVATAETLLAQLHVVGAGSLQLQRPDGTAVTPAEKLQSGDQLIARDASGQLAERYELE